MDSAPTAGPEERSCCRSVLLMNYDTKRFEEVPGEKNSPDRVNLPPGVSLEPQAEKRTISPFYFLLPSLSCSEGKNPFLWGLLITK